MDAQDENKIAEVITETFPENQAIFSVSTIINNAKILQKARRSIAENNDPKIIKNEQEEPKKVDVDQLTKKLESCMNLLEEMEKNVQAQNPQKDNMELVIKETKVEIYRVKIEMSDIQEKNKEIKKEIEELKERTIGSKRKYEVPNDAIQASQKKLKMIENEEIKEE